jgi:hypothetical protein
MRISFCKFSTLKKFFIIFFKPNCLYRPNDGAPLENRPKEMSKDKAKAEQSMRQSMDDQEFSKNSLDVALALVEYLSDLKHDLVSLSIRISKYLSLIEIFGL